MKTRDIDKEKFHKYNQEIDKLESSTGYGKSFLISALFGAGFGLLFLVVSLFFESNPDPFLYYLPLLCGGISGIGGLLGSFV
ncbi:MAG: hypothetical protein ACLFUI_03290, partial [Halanaerobiales bacterium]